MQFRISFALLAGLALLACSPKADDKMAERPETDDPNAAIVADNPFFGKWQLIRAQIAPWWDHQGPEPQADTNFTMVNFEPGKSSGAPIVTCSKPQYSVSLVGPPVLFEGNLKEPWVEARQLGFTITGNDITQLNFSCKDGNRDVSLDFPMLNDNTIFLGLDNIIYTLQRSAS